MRVPRNARRSNLLVLKEINPECSLEGLMLWPLDAKSRLIGKEAVLGKTESKRSKGKQRIRWLDGITDSMDMNLSKPWETVKDRGTWCAAVHWVAKRWTGLSD